MILIADSGSTTADWCLIKPSGDHWEWTTPGINPYLQSVQEIKRILRLLVAIDNDQILTIHYYGTGCSNETNCNRVIQALHQVFPNAQLNTHSDLLGACRAALGNQKGHVAILGTGSNACFYDGHNIHRKFPCLGYVLGDEGSGTHLGKLLLRSYFYEEMPEHLRTLFERNFSPTGHIISQIYQRPRPNAYLASFSTFLSANRDEEFCQELVKRSFQEFLNIHLLKYDHIRTLPLYIIGSIGQHFQELIRGLLENEQIEIGGFIQKPIQDLAHYHQNDLR